MTSSAYTRISALKPAMPPGISVNSKPRLRGHRTALSRTAGLGIALLITGAVTLAQQGTVGVSGTVLDSSGALISGASVVLSSAGREILRTSTDAKGTFRFDAVVPGKYEMLVNYAGFSPNQTSLTVGTKAPNPARIVLAIAPVQYSLKVDSQSERVSTEAGENMNAVRINSRQLDNLPLLDRDVIGAISRSLGPGGMLGGEATVMVDGLRNSGQGIPLSQIEEVIVNDNPYSAEFAEPGQERIEIITKSGSEEYHGSIDLALQDYRFDARNAFASTRPPMRHRQLEANLSGPIHGDKKNTFQISASWIRDNLEPSVYALGLEGPILENASQREASTYLSAQNTRRIGAGVLTFRYSHFSWSDNGEDTGGLVLSESGIDSTIHYEDLYSSFQAVINPKLLNDLFVSARIQTNGTQSELPGVLKVVVQDAFTGGGAQVASNGTDTHIEFSDVLTWTHGKHLLKAGASVPTFGRFGSTDRSNFNGTFYFSSLSAYASGSPYSYTQQSGDGHLVFWQKQAGAFVEDQIKLRPNLSVVAGLRYDWQNYGSDYHNFAPRLSFAYAPGKTRATVFRGGAGMFFQPVPAGAIADTLLLNGTRFQQIQLLNPLYPNPFAGGIAMSGIPPNIVRFSPTLKSPYLFKYSFGVERQLRESLTWTATASETRGVDMFRSRDVNAPLPPDYLTPPNPLLGVVRQIESSGGLKSQSLQTTLRGEWDRFSGEAVYELSRATNDTDGIDSFPANNWNPTGEWGRASFDARNFFYLYGTFTAAKYLTFGAIVSANSGHPYTITTGLDSFNDGMVNARPIGVPRNTLQGSGAATLDLNWSNDFALPKVGRDRKLEPVLKVGVDAFNLFNRVNYTSFVGDLSSPFFGKPIAADPARRLQLTLTLKF
jgi:outer membrane receptor protein involved in Fe transport